MMEFSRARALFLLLLAWLGIAIAPGQELSWLNPSQAGARRIFACPARDLLVTVDGVVKKWRLSDHRYLGSFDCEWANSENNPDADLSPDGSILAVVCNADLCYYSTETGALLAKFRGEGGTSVRFLPDGKSILVGFDPDGHFAWTPAVAQIPVLTGDEERTYDLGLFDDPTWLRVSPDGKRFVIGCMYAVEFWKLEDSAPYRKIFDHVSIGAISPDGQTLALGVSRGLRFRDMLTGDLKGWKRADSTPTTLTYTPDGATLLGLVYAGWAPGEAVGWNTHDWSERFSREIGRIDYREIGLAATSPANFYYASEEGLIEADSNTGAVQDQIAPYEGGGELAVSPDGRTVVQAGGVNVRAFDVETGAELWSIPTESYTTSTVVAYSADSQWLALASDVEVHLCSAATGKVIRSFPTDQPAQGVAFSPDGHLLAIAESGYAYWLQSLHVVNPATGDVVFDTPLDAWVIAPPAFIPGSGKLVVAEGRGLDVYDPATWQVVDTVVIDQNYNGRHFGVSRDGSTIVVERDTGYWLGEVILRASDLSIEGEWPPKARPWARFLDISPDSHRMWVITFDEVRELGIPIPRQIFTINNPEAKHILDLATSPSGKVVFTRPDGTIGAFDDPGK